MTNSKDLQQIMKEIGSIQLKGAALGWSGRQTYEEYKGLLPPEVTLVNFPSKCLNCAGYALDFTHSTSNPQERLSKDYEKVHGPKDADIYIMYIAEDWVHMGKVLNEDTAISKWAWFEPVFIHPILFFSGGWDRIDYFRKKDL